MLKHQNTKYVRQLRGHLIIFVSNLVLNLSSDLIIPGLVTNGTAEICCLGLILVLF